MKRLLTIIGILTTSLTVNAQVRVDPSADLGKDGQQLTLSSPIVVPLSVIASNARQVVSRGVFMAGGKVLVDSRSDREQMIKPLAIVLKEQKVDHCELNYHSSSYPHSDVILHARMRLDYFGQGAEMFGPNNILMAYRIVQESNRTDFADNEITMIQCTTFLPANLSPRARVPVSVLLDALGPRAIVTK